MFLQAETSFGLNVLNSLRTNESFVFSPLSIALALSLVHSGARGASKDQIGNTLLSGASDEQFVNHFQFISDALRQGTNGIKVDVANKVYLQKGVTPSPSYLATVLKNYKASAESLDLTTPAAVQTINKFVKDATEGKIGDLVTQDSIKDAVALLVNALYFKGDWENEFEGMSTHDKEFTQKAGVVKKIPFMSDWMSDRGYASDDLFQVLVLNYKDPAYRFAIFLPKIKNSLGDAVKKLDAARLQKLLVASKSTFMNTFIPKFTVQKELKLKDVLSKLGITQIFSDAADLSGIAPNIKISDVAHKALIEVNELGTVAAAATVAKAIPMSGRMGEPITFNADHPFLFALVRENHPLFLGVFHG
ncbi:unnamed protein product [Caenorhabditis sp. 36 PRJEB53466]|nr:unnamed protein product [Caenorhabditis sp. 36 PRJEB53466]